MFTCCTRTTCLPWALLSLSLSLAFALHILTICVWTCVCTSVCVFVCVCVSYVNILKFKTPDTFSRPSHARTHMPFYAVGGPSPLSCTLVFSKMLISLLQCLLPSVPLALLFTFASFLYQHFYLSFYYSLVFIVSSLYFIYQRISFSDRFIKTKTLSKGFSSFIRKFFVIWLSL